MALIEKGNVIDYEINISHTQSNFLSHSFNDCDGRDKYISIFFVSFQAIWLVSEHL